MGPLAERARCARIRALNGLGIRDALAATVAVLGLVAGCGDEVIGYAVSDTESTADSETSEGSDDSGGVDDALPDWVAVGFMDTIAVSFDDGRSWSVVPDPEIEGETTREGMIRGPDRIVIVGGMHTLVSTDGMTWDVYGDALGYARDVAWGNDTFVSVGLDRLARSDDAVGWVDARNGAFDFDLSSVAYGNGRFVAVGWDSLGTSVDGVTWELTELTGPKVYSIAFGNGRFVGVGEEGRVIVTTDGVTLDSDTTQGPYFDGICFFQGEFVALSGWTVRTSEDAVEWREFAIEPAHSLGCGPASIVGVQEDWLNRGDDLLSMEPVQSLGVPMHTAQYTGPGG